MRCRSSVPPGIQLSNREEWMEVLIDAEFSRKEAITTALEGFGDKVALAHHFMTITFLKRRCLMRYTYGTIAAVTCAILVLATFWPEVQTPLTSQEIAQSKEGGTPNAKLVTPVKQTTSPFANSRAKIETILDEPWEVEFFDTSLQVVMDTLNKEKGIGFFIDPRVIDEIDTGQLISIRVGKNELSGKTLLQEFILGPLELSYIIRDNSLIITTCEEYEFSPDRYVVVVYNCRDLLAGRPPGKPPVGGAGRGFAGDHNSVSNAQFKPPAEAKDSSPGTDREPEGDTPGSVPRMPPPIAVELAARERQLMKVIRTAIRNEDSPWDDEFGVNDETIGSMEAINGLLVIRQTREIHEKVEQLLELMREAGKQGDWPVDVGGWPNYENHLPYTRGAERPGTASGHFF